MGRTSVPILAEMPSLHPPVDEQLDIVHALRAVLDAHLVRARHLCAAAIFEALVEALACHLMDHLHQLRRLLLLLLHLLQLRSTSKKSG